MRPGANHACWSVPNPVTLGRLLDSVLVTYATQRGDKEPREKGKMKRGEIRHVRALSAVRENRIIPHCHTLHSPMTHW